MCLCNSTLNYLLQTSLAAAEALSAEESGGSACRDAFEFALAMLGVKQGKAEDQLQTYKQHRSEIRLGLMSFSGNDTESVMPAAEESYGSFQVMI